MVAQVKLSLEGVAGRVVAKSVAGDKRRCGMARGANDTAV